MLLRIFLQATLVIAAVGGVGSFRTPLPWLRGPKVTIKGPSRVHSLERTDEVLAESTRRRIGGLQKLHQLLEYPVLLPFQKARSTFSPWSPVGEKGRTKLVCSPLLQSIMTPEPRSPLVDQDHQRNSNFTLNVGHAMDVLRIDIPLCFDKQLDMSIYTEDVRFRDDFRVFSQGKFMYSLVFFTLRVAKGFMPLPPIVELIAVRWCEARQCIYARFQIRIDTLSGEPIYFDAVSLYRVNEQGIIFEHILEKVIRNDLMERATAASLAEMLVASPLPQGEKSLGGF